MEDKFKSFLKEVAPYVVVVGSYSRFKENEFSDIDFYIRRRPQKDIDKDMDENCGDAEETYMSIIIDIVKKYNLRFTSVIFGHIAIEKQANIPQMLEFSYLYKIPNANEIFIREIYGIKFLCCEDDKESNYEDLYDYTDFVDGDIANLYPLPDYYKYIGV